jgi:cell division protein FtsA
MLGGEVRLGVPRALKGAPAGASGPGFATLTGLISYAQSEEVQPSGVLGKAPLEGEGGYFTRVGRWLKQGF